MEYKELFYFTLSLPKGDGSSAAIKRYCHSVYFHCNQWQKLRQSGIFTAITADQYETNQGRVAHAYVYVI